MDQKLAHGRRFQPLAFDQLTQEQRLVAERVLGGPRGKLGPAWNVLLRCPAVASTVEQLGAYVRYTSSLPPAISELAILAMARDRTVQYLWHVHRPIALASGLSPTTMDEIAAGKRPSAMTADEVAAYDFIHQLIHRTAVSDDVYADALGRFGETGIVDLIGLFGYYQIVFTVLMVDRHELPEGVAPPLKPLPAAEAD